MIKEAAPELTGSSSEAEEEKEEPQPRVDGERDPDFIQVSQSASQSVRESFSQSESQRGIQPVQ